MRRGLGILCGAIALMVGWSAPARADFPYGRQMSDGWDFLDDDNDPYDDVQYGHGTGEARDSGAEADDGGDLGTCPNCTIVPLRVGTSFIADVDRFALAALYATDNGVSVIQEALGTLNKSRLGRDAVEYAYRHGVVTIASAADDAAR
jgi:subtilisin family serine protease